MDLKRILVAVNTPNGRAENAGVRVQTVEQHGDAAEIIELHANARAVDLIVMGTQARRGWGRQRSLLAERVIRRTAVPTLVVASDASDSAPSNTCSWRLICHRLPRMSSLAPLD